MKFTKVSTITEYLIEEIVQCTNIYRVSASSPQEARLMIEEGKVKAIDHTGDRIPSNLKIYNISDPNPPRKNLLSMLNSSNMEEIDLPYLKSEK